MKIRLDHKKFIFLIIMNLVIGMILQSYWEEFNWIGWMIGGIGGGFLLSLRRVKEEKELEK